MAEVTLDPSLLTNTTYGSAYGPAAWGNSDLGNNDSSTGGSGTSSGFFSGLSLGDLGKYGLGIYSILSNRNNNKDAIALGKNQLQFGKDQAAANFLQNGIGWANQQLWNTQAMFNFDQKQGAQFANNLKTSLESLNAAGAKLGLNGAFDNQINSLSQYTQLKDTANAQG